MPGFGRYSRHALRVAIVIAAVLPASARAFNTLDGDRTAWQINPTYTVVNGSSDIADGSDEVAIRRSFTTWQNVADADISFREVARGGDITVEFLARWPREYGADAAGVTLTQRDRGVITSAEVSINEQNFDWATDGDPNATDIEGVVTHEVGHGLGLGHSRSRTATMYWSGGDLELRSLDADDERGLVFLYGNGRGRGLLCDQCAADADCANAGRCLELNDGRLACGQPCDRNNRCEAGAACYELRGGGSQCVPNELFCADDGGPGLVAEGDYCWGADQCAQGSTCVPLPGGSAVCARECVSDRGCPAGAICLGAEAGRGVCVPGGDAAFGGACETSFDCASLLCVPLDEVSSVCTEGCSPNANDCPGGVGCVAVQDAGDLEGVCIPPGNVGDGGACGDAAQRCAPGLTCILESVGEDPVCRESCAPFGECPRGRGCTPYSADDWFCLPLTGADVGEACNPEAASCQGGLFCIANGNDGVCVSVCDDNDAEACRGAGCFDIDGNDGNLGICSPGAGEFGAVCESGVDCLSFQCVADGDAGMCSRACSRADACPEGFDCRALRTGETLCFRGEGGGTGGEPGAAGEPGNGGGPGAGGNPGPSAGGEDPGTGGDGPEGAATPPPVGGDASEVPSVGADGGVTGPTGPGAVRDSGGSSGGCAARPGSAPSSAFAVFACAVLGMLSRRRRAADRLIVRASSHHSEEP